MKEYVLKFKQYINESHLYEKDSFNQVLNEYDELSLDNLGKDLTEDELFMNLDFIENIINAKNLNYDSVEYLGKYTKDSQNKIPITQLRKDYYTFFGNYMQSIFDKIQQNNMNIKGFNIDNIKTEKIYQNKNTFKYKDKKMLVINNTFEMISNNVSRYNALIRELHDLEHNFEYAWKKMLLQNIYAMVLEITLKNKN